MTWRWMLGWASATSAGILAHRGDWRAATGLGVIVAALLAWRARDLLAAGKAEMIRESLEALAPEPPVPAPRLERAPRPPWDTATMPAIPHEADCPLDPAGRHRRARGLRDVVADALRAVAHAYLS